MEKTLTTLERRPIRAGHCTRSQLRSALLLLATAACADKSDRQSPEEGSPTLDAIVRDSAGIRIIESSTPVWDGDGWRVSDTPSVVIGRREEDDRYLFGSIGGGVVLRDGRIAVLDRLAAVIRVYSPKGTHIEDWGRTGEGPGEFTAAEGLFPYRGDSLLVSGSLAFEWLHVDPEGNVWAGRRRYEAGDDMDEFFVFAGHGRYLGIVEVPAKLSVLQIGTDFILAQSSDDLDVQYVHLYRIGK